VNAVSGDGRRRGGGDRRMVPDAEVRTYYDKPILKPPTWKWYIPGYFFAGGLAGGSSLVGAAASFTGRPRLARSAHLTAAGAITVGAGFLVADLGRPERFLKMLRVAKLTSPMSVGTWILTAYAPTAAVAALSDVSGRAPRLGRVATTAAATLAPALASYTAVLVADTAVPAWHEAHEHLPWVFVAGAAASAGGVAAALTPVAEAGPARRLAIAGAAAELLAHRRMESHLSPEVGRAHHHNSVVRWKRAAEVLLSAGALTTVLLGRRRPAAVVGGLMVAVGTAAERFEIFYAGIASAQDPAATSAPQRRRLEHRPD
jgi:hypothetical protein